MTWVRFGSADENAQAARCLLQYDAFSLSAPSSLRRSSPKNPSAAHASSLAPTSARPGVRSQRQ
eukprot:CAMPEP_0198686934 /NCGR_PEP_ID=MMETSP1468-20131203/32509_1 /TAXON_ID=1461545 /ORGANISM="Mantoniella sp, Strain CCMP1436" /LENGTH=63 /DNA_ID=CAMNT_0044433773 /DNA_START=646 /DNA_END=835 /DNA_ORIENTATION=+